MKILGADWLSGYDHFLNIYNIYIYNKFCVIHNSYLIVFHNLRLNTSIYPQTIGQNGKKIEYTACIVKSICRHFITSNS